MIEPNAYVYLKDGLSVAVKKMEEKGISSVFVVDPEERIKGIVTIDDAIKGRSQKKKIEDIMRHNIHIVHKEEYVNDLIPKAVESKFPLAVVDDEEKLVGLILRVHVLSGLISDEDEL